MGVLFATSADGPLASFSMKYFSLCTLCINLQFTFDIISFDHFTKKKSIPCIFKLDSKSVLELIKVLQLIRFLRKQKKNFFAKDWTLRWLASLI